MGVISLSNQVVGRTGGYTDRIDTGTGTSGSGGAGSGTSGTTTTTTTGPGGDGTTGSIVAPYSPLISVLPQFNGKPGGIESIFEYNGGQLNVRQWLDTFLVTQIDGLADADIRDSREVNPGRHGETYYNAYYGGRTIVLSGRIRAHTITKLRDMQRGLREIFADISTELPLTIGGSSDLESLMIYCKKAQPIVMAEVQQDYTFRRDFQVTLRASNPRFVSYIENRLVWAPTVAVTPNVATVVLTPTNEGNFNAEPILRIVGPLSAAVTGGPAATMTVRSVNAVGLPVAKTMTLNAKSGTTLAIASGNFIDFDASARTVKEYNASGTFVGNAYSQFDVASDWIEFVPGQNPIEFTVYGTGNTPQLIARWRHTYM